MGLPIPGLRWRDAGPEGDNEWTKVPIYAAIKDLAEPWVLKAFNIERVGEPSIPQDDGVILASNHASYFDPVFIGAVVDRPIHWLAKADLFRHPLGDAFFSKAGGIKVDRVSGGNQAAVETSIQVVEDGRVSGIFPEGSRSLDGQIRRARTGVARVAMRTGAPVVPVALNSYDLLPKHTKVPHLDDPLIVAVGEPVRYEGMEDLATDRATCRKVADDVMAEVARLLELSRTHRDRLVLEAQDD